MAKPKAKTLQQKLGFLDEDLNKPEHDDILKWLDQNIEEVIYELYPLEDWNQKHIDNLKKSVDKIVADDLESKKNHVSKIDSEIKSLQQEIIDTKEYLRQKNDSFYQNNLRKLRTEIDKKGNLKKSLKNQIQSLKKFKGIGNNLPKRNPIRITKIEWEYTVTSQNRNDRTGYKSSKYIIGYVDMRVTFVYSKLIVEGIDFTKKEVIGEIKWAQSEKVSPRSTDLNTYDIFIEVKTEIKSLGSLFRQLKTYQEYVDGDFIVVSPDDSDRKIIEDQGFNFFKFKQ